MENKDIRWLQRFKNFKKAFSQLEDAVELGKYSNLERQGLIKAFEFTYELAWNTLKDFLNEKGFTEIIGSKDTIRLAFKNGLIENGESWMKMLKSRNITAHTYDLETAIEIEHVVRETYYDLFAALQIRMEGEKKIFEKPDDETIEMK